MLDVMRAGLIAGWLGLLVALAHAQSPWPQLPPPRYDHAYHGHLVVYVGTEAQIHAWCGSYFAHACAKPGRSCVVYLPATGDPQILAALRRHEVGHCNGWRH